MFNVAGDFNWRHNFAGRPELFLPIGLFFLYGIYLSFRKIKKDKLQAAPEIILLGWLGTVMLPVVISNEGLPHALRSILMIPPVFILSAIGGMEIYEILRSKVSKSLLSVLVYAFLGLLVFESYMVYFAWSNHPSVRESFSRQDYMLSEQINSLPRDIEKIVVVSGTDRTIERDYPIFLQSILFLTDTFSAEKRLEKNIRYLTPGEQKSAVIPAGSKVIPL